jgi:molybdopterin-guanine dinucleotide biosynthesis protein A
MSGAPKGLSLVGGVRILDRLVAAFEDALGALPILVANSEDAPTWCPGLRVVRDIRPGSGALGGIYTAVVQAPAPVVVAAWDMPFVTAALLRELAAGLQGVDACLPASDGPRGLEPLCAAYGPAAGPAIAAALDAGDLRAVGFHDRIKIGMLSPERVRQHGDPALLFLNVNTIDDLMEAERQWRNHASSR